MICEWVCGRKLWPHGGSHEWLSGHLEPQVLPATPPSRTSWGSVSLPCVAQQYENDRFLGEDKRATYRAKPLTSWVVNLGIRPTRPVFSLAVSFAFKRRCTHLKFISSSLSLVQRMEIGKGFTLGTADLSPCHSLPALHCTALRCATNDQL